MDKSIAAPDFWENVTASIKHSLPKREWDWQAAVLAVLLVQIAAARLSITKWVPSLNVVILLSFYAVCLGLVIGYGGLSRRNAIWMGVEYGLLLIPLQFLKAIETTGVLHEDLRGILVRLFDSVVFLAENQPVNDTIFFLALMSIGFWAIGMYTGYQLARHGNFIPTVVSPGLAMLIVQVYDPWISRRVWAFAFYFFVSLALLGRCNFLKNSIFWKTKRVFHTTDSEWDISRSVVSFAAVAVLAVWALPSALNAVDSFAREWRGFVRPIEKKFSNPVAALDSPYGAPPSSDFYSSSLGLGDSAPVSDTIVFSVEVNHIESEPTRYYWRGRIYDHYENGQWTNTDVTRRDFDPDTDEMPFDITPLRSEAIFTVTTNFPRQELIYAPSEMIWVDRAGRVVSTTATDSDADVNAWMASPSLVAGDRYQVRSRIANPSIEELRNAGTEYPAWVTDRYLQVPTDVKRPLETLAQRVAGAYITPYNKAQAVTAYLRKEIQYTTKLIDSPPSYQDPVVWSVFEYKQGFCMYSASAEVLMLRTLGIPARMAVGFAEGDFDPEENHYVVTQADSHAWPEAYFPGIGWVEFEPTGNQSPLNRPQRETREETAGLEPGDSTNNRPDQNTDDEFAENPNNDPLLREDELMSRAAPTAGPGTSLALWAAFLIFFSAGVYIVQRYSFANRLPIYLQSRYAKNGQRPPAWIQRWASWAILAPVERAFHAVDLSLRWFGRSQPAHVTPVERANALGRLLPSAQEAIATLEREHEIILFTNHDGNLAAARKAALSILFESLRKTIREGRRPVMD
ncbi:MAG: hypothetical protein HYZ23_06425 [Chloroflexi bacterium]|nr:hypothetical protein [Chloroflexota bacterium]